MQLFYNGFTFHYTSLSFEVQLYSSESDTERLIVVPQAFNRRVVESHGRSDNSNGLIWV